MAPGLRKCIDMMPTDFIGDFEDVFSTDSNGVPNWEKVRASGTRWCRIWARWDLIETSRGVYNTSFLSRLDQQIAKMISLGIGVVLVSYHFPRWTNGTENLTPPAPSYNPEFRTYADGSGFLKLLEWQVPALELGVDEAYGRWIDFLIQRYRQHGSALILEIMNEPNYQMWPQRQGAANSSPLIIHQKVAEMMYTAWQVSAFRGHPLRLAAPATSDFRRGTTRYETNQGDFIPALKTALASYNNFRGGPSFLWSLHNYIDVETGSDVAPFVARANLQNWWLGWSPTNPNGSDPGIWITEGGARRSKVSPPTYQRQAEMVSAAWSRLLSYPGVAMFTNYGLHTDPNYETGLRDPLPGPGNLRPVGQVFHGFPGNV
jgi:hypothetical protein